MVANGLPFHSALVDSGGVSPIRLKVHEYLFRTDYARPKVEISKVFVDGIPSDDNSSNPISNGMTNRPRSNNSRTDPTRGDDTRKKGQTVKMGESENSTRGGRGMRRIKTEWRDP